MKQIRFKMPYYSYILILCVLAVFLFKSCEKDKFQHPVAHTGEVTEISPEGATFHGRITEMGSLEIVDHGFLWGTEKEPSPANSIRVSLGKPERRDFQNHLNNSLRNNTKYYVRVFLTDSKGLTFYGRIVNFISMGSLAPEISSIIPQSGVWRDTITIYGKRLGVSPDHATVLFDNIEAQIITHNTDSLKIIVPDELLDSQASISVIVAGNTGTYENPFIIKAPEIYSLSQEYCSRGDTLIINGFGFHPHKINNKVYLGENEITVHAASPNQLKIIHSDYYNHGDYILSLKVIDQKIDYQNIFTIYEPWRQLKDIPWQDAAVTIGFSMNNRGYVTNTYPEYDKVLEYVPAEDQWVQKNNHPSEYPNNAFTTGNHAYIIDFFSGFFQYNFDTDQWTEKANLPPSDFKFEYSTFSIGTSGYVCGGYNTSGWYQSTNRLLKYNEETNTWTHKRSFPLPGISEGIGFSINGKGYVGLGRSDEYTPILELYEYDPNSNQWALKISFEDILYESNYGRILSSVFVINNKAYIFSGSRATGTYYSTESNDIYEFDPITNIIRRLPDCPSLPRLKSFSFAVNGKGYIGGGFAPGSMHKDFWEFDPGRLPPVRK